MKKALAFAKEYLDLEGNPQNSEVSSMKCVLNNVLDDMKVRLEEGKMMVSSSMTQNCHQKEKLIKQV